LNPRALRFLGFNKIAQLIFSRALTILNPLDAREKPFTRPDALGPDAAK